MKGVRRGCVRLKGAIIGIDDQDVNTFTITVDHKTFHFQVSSVQRGQKTAGSHVWLTIFHFSGNNSPHTHTPNPICTLYLSVTCPGLSRRNGPHTHKHRIDNRRAMQRNAKNGFVAWRTRYCGTRTGAERCGTSSTTTAAVARAHRAARWASQPAASVAVRAAELVLAVARVVSVAVAVVHPAPVSGAPTIWSCSTGR